MINLFSTDRHWETFAKSDPFWAVASFDKFKNENLDAAAFQEFFDSGETHVELILKEIRAKLDPDFQPASALDFGCGVGRLLIPFAKKCKTVTGVDVSETMLRQARSYADERGLTNIELVKGDDHLTGVNGTYDLVHSVLVFQHIPVRRGEKIVQAMMKRMHPGSVGILHFTYTRSIETARPTLGYRWQRFRERLRMLRGAIFGRPIMQMNDYSLNNLFRILQKAGVLQIQIRLMDHVGAQGAVLFFRIPRRDEKVNPFSFVS